MKKGAFLRVEKEHEILVIITLVANKQMFYNANTDKHMVVSYWLWHFQYDMWYNVKKCRIGECDMIKIAKCLSDEYIHSYRLKNFCLDHKMPVSEVKADLLSQVLEYAGDDESTDAYKETYKWVLDTVKSGSKEFCLKRIYIPDDTLNDAAQIIKNKYDQCPQQDILSYKNTERFGLANYKFTYTDQGKISVISFLFSGILLEGNTEYERGDRIIYPIYIDFYVDQGFIVARYKPKTTIYVCSENDIIYKENRFKPLDRSADLINDLMKIFKMQNMDINPVSNWGKMLYKLYLKYSFTPSDIQKKVRSMEIIRNNFINEMFETLNLREVNKKKAIVDMDILLEKFISINGNMEKIFKEDREAYLIKISSDDILQMTRIDTASTGNRPLQCSDTFFDGKKSILNTKECRILHLCYNRNRKYLGPFTVQLTSAKNLGVVKMYYDPEEVDIQNVLQRIFENY